MYIGIEEAVFVDLWKSLRAERVVLLFERSESEMATPVSFTYPRIAILQIIRTLLLKLSELLVETFAFTELAAQVDLSSDYTLYQYRDIDQREIDFLIENDDGDLAGIEVKAGSGVGKDDFKHLVWFRDHLAKSRRFVGIVLYSGAQVLSFGNGMLAVPISSLWSE